MTAKYALPFGDNVNREAFLELKKHILDEPRRFVMETWLVEWIDGAPYSAHYIPYALERPPCDTAACFCGWVNILDAEKHGTSPDGGLQDIVGNQSRALRILGVEDFPGSRSNRLKLFNYNYWPSPFSEQYDNATNAQQRADAAAGYIDYILGDYPRPKEVKWLEYERCSRERVTEDDE